MQSSPLSQEKYCKDAKFCWRYLQMKRYLGFDTWKNWNYIDRDMERDRENID